MLGGLTLADPSYPFRQMARWLARQAVALWLPEGYLHPPIIAEEVPLASLGKGILLFMTYKKFSKSLPLATG